ncbi:shikimate kinase [Aquimarina sp. W85]|uniref:shikimate kinase n=1 Tax=Aquimarina rhodophyticola TaxID=3342246 RepID=UPI00366B20A6
MNIVLLGYMGSGKSLIGKKLSKNIGFDFLDLDTYIEKQEKKSISLIFSEKGEVYFRKKETFYLKELLKSTKNSVIALGGGTPCFGDNMQSILNDDAHKSVYLQTSLDVLTDRLFNQRNKRPMISHIKSKVLLHDFIRKHLFERSFYYNQSLYKIQTDHKTVDQIIDEIKTLF